jgi:hypothetical protein
MRQGALPALLLVAACSGNTRHAAVSAHDELSALQAVPVRVRTSAAAAPVGGLAVSGTITNNGRRPLRCSALALYVVDPNGNAVAPASQFCDVPSIAPDQSGYFSATFDTQRTEDLQLRFEHGDGSYETHDLIVPPG